MEALIKISTEEFNQELFNQLEKLVKRYKNGKMTISLKDNAIADFDNESNEQYEARLLNSIAELDEGKGVTFTMESLEAYIKNLANE